MGKKNKSLKRYTVTISRVSYASRDIEVEAGSKREAEKLAREKEGDFEYREHTVEYLTDGVELSES